LWYESEINQGKIGALMKNSKSAITESRRDSQKLEVAIQKGKEQKFPTKNTLPEKIRKNIEAILQDRLADSIDLQTQAKQAHWNVKGPNFIALHELFDKIAEESEAYPDLIAERIAQFGGVAEGTIQVAANRTSLPAYPLIVKTGREHVELFSHTLAVYGELIRTTIKQAADLDDPATADIFTEISRGVDKNLWFIEAHNEAEK
jgi:starvation-inducible DNA-binding protein